MSYYEDNYLKLEYEPRNGHKDSISLIIKGLPSDVPFIEMECGDNYTCRQLTMVELRKLIEALQTMENKLNES